MNPRSRMTRAFLVATAILALVFAGCGEKKPRIERNIELPPVLAKIQQLVQIELDSLNLDLKNTAAELAKVPLNGDVARRLLLGLRTRNQNIVDCSTIDLNGKLLAIEPIYYAQYEGKYIGDQEQIKRLFKSEKPVMSSIIHAVEGFDAVDIDWPIFDLNKKLLGAVSALIRPESLLTQIITPEVEGFPIDFCVMDTDGIIIYDPDFEEVGRNLFTDELYAPFPELRALGKQIAKYIEGSGSYTFYSTGMKRTVKKNAIWTSAGLHGTEWRLVLIQPLPEDEAAAKRTLDDLHIATYKRALSELALDKALARAMEADDSEAVLAKFETFIKYYPAIYSIQYVNPKGINLYGWPKEHSLFNYDFSSGRTGNDSKFLRSVEMRKEASFVINLLEGGQGDIFMCPVYSESKYEGMIYSIRLLP